LLSIVYAPQQVLVYVLGLQLLRKGLECAQQCQHIPSDSFVNALDSHWSARVFCYWIIPKKLLCNCFWLLKQAQGLALVSPHWLSLWVGS